MGWAILIALMTTFSPTPPVQAGQTDRIEVPANWVLDVMTKTVPNDTFTVRVTYDETAEAIAMAANQNPIFPGKDGAVQTASFLLAIAYHESRFNPTAVGDHGASLGLFQIQMNTAHVSANMLLVPREAAPIAINLIKTSKVVCGHFGWSEQLGWYCAGGNGCKARGRAQSRSRVFLAGQIMRDNPVKDSEGRAIYDDVPLLRSPSDILIASDGSSQEDE